MSRRLLIPTYSRKLAADTALILDTYSSAESAVSFNRKPRTAYSGNAIRIRRLSDNAELDIGFDGNDIDSAAIESHCSGTTGYVVTAYDQSGNGNDLTNATTIDQPIIYTGGALVTVNSKIAPLFDGSNDNLKAATYQASILSSCVFTGRINGDAANQAAFGQYNNNSGNLYFGLGSSSGNVVATLWAGSGYGFNTTSTAVDAQQILTLIGDSIGSNTFTVYINDTKELDEAVDPFANAREFDASSL